MIYQYHYHFIDWCLYVLINFFDFLGFLYFFLTNRFLVIFKLINLDFFNFHLVLNLFYYLIIIFMGFIKFSQSIIEMKIKNFFRGFNHLFKINFKFLIGLNQDYDPLGHLPNQVIDLIYHQMNQFHDFILTEIQTNLHNFVFY